LFLVFVFFFFQAEDGIRDVAVTGVQTCALPISSTSPESAQRASLPEMGSVSSATTLRTTTSYPRSAAQSTTASPDVSARWPTAPRSEIVRMPIRIIPSLTVPYRLLPSSFRPMRHERELHDFRRRCLTPDVDLNLRPRLGALARQLSG